MRPTTTPGPPVASIVRRSRGRRVGDPRLRARLQGPGRCRRRPCRLSGASGPEASRRRTVTDSGRRRGLKTSISEDPPVSSSASGIEPVVCGVRGARHDGEPGRGPEELLELGGDDAAGPGGDDRAHRRHVLHLGRHVLHLDLSRLQDDALVIDRVDGARRRDEAEVDHDRRRRRVEQRDVQRVRARGRAAGEVPGGRRRALARGLGPPVWAVAPPGSPPPRRPRRSPSRTPRTPTAGGGMDGPRPRGPGPATVLCPVAPLSVTAVIVPATGVHRGIGQHEEARRAARSRSTAPCSTRPRTRHRARATSAPGAGGEAVVAGVPPAAARTPTPATTRTTRASTRHRRSRLWWAGLTVAPRPGSSAAAVAERRRRSRGRPAPARPHERGRQHDPGRHLEHDGQRDEGELRERQRRLTLGRAVLRRPTEGGAPGRTCGRRRSARSSRPARSRRRRCPLRPTRPPARRSSRRAEHRLPAGHVRRPGYGPARQRRERGRPLRASPAWPRRSGRPARPTRPARPAGRPARGDRCRARRAAAR